MNARFHVSLPVAAALAACSGEHHEPHTSDPLPTVEVTTLKLEAEQLRRAEAVPGTVRARLESTLEAKLPGRIRRMPVKLGDKVRAGQLVAVLEAREVEARLGQAEARLAQAKSELNRYSRLFEKKAATRQELEGVRTRYEVAVASVREARSMLQEAKITAPFAGVITRDFADVGDLATPGRPIVTVSAPGALRLEVAVSETLLGFVELGQTIPVEVGDGPKLDGVVGEIAPSADPGSRTFTVKIDIPETEGVRPGQFGRALMPAREAEILRIPSEAVIRRGQLEIVFVVEDGVAKLRLVKTGRRFDGQVEVASGLDAGEVLVIEGAGQLVDGQPVRGASGTAKASGAGGAPAEVR